jgi:glycosyltransferase involved in cell wall biosynthesis
MSITLLEAASVGAPTVCSDIPANVAVMQDQAGYFRSGDADDLARKLRWALDHPREMREQGRRAQAWVRQNLAWDDIVERYEQLYRQVCG